MTFLNIATRQKKAGGFRFFVLFAEDLRFHAH